MRDHVRPTSPPVAVYAGILSEALLGSVLEWGGQIADNGTNIAGLEVVQDLYDFEELAQFSAVEIYVPNDIESQAVVRNGSAIKVDPFVKTANPVVLSYGV
jgi:hypothetical protein